jgi:hypothetical protein
VSVTLNCAPATCGVAKARRNSDGAGVRILAENVYEYAASSDGAWMDVRVRPIVVLSTGGGVTTGPGDVLRLWATTWEVRAALERTGPEQ